MPTLYVLATAKHSIWCHKKSVLRKKHGHCGGVVLVVCLVQLPMKVTELTYCLGRPKEITLLDYWWLGRVLLLSEDWQKESRADCQSD
jgi:hypothetical protein